MRSRRLVVAAAALGIFLAPLAAAEPGDEVGLCGDVDACVRDGEDGKATCAEGRREESTTTEVGVDRDTQLGVTHVYIAMPIARMRVEESCWVFGSQSENRSSYTVTLGGQGQAAVGPEGFRIEGVQIDALYWTQIDSNETGVRHNQTMFGVAGEQLTYEANTSDPSDPVQAYCRPRCPFTMPPPPDSDAGNLASCGHGRESMDPATLECYARQEAAFYTETAPVFSQVLLDRWTRPLTTCPAGTPCRTVDPPSPQLLA